ncbi:MAG: HAD family hydrolase [Chthoniobacterales bacterium]
MDQHALTMTAPAPLRLAMWSGPRNISTAMMRSWGNRPDTAVVDEPFYAFYLNKTGADHPAINEVIAAGETDPHNIIRHMTGAIPAGKRIFYQKQMTHHLLPAVDRDWLRDVTNCFLIRDPADVIASYTKKNHEPSLDDLGFVQQEEIFDFVCREITATPPIVDAADVLRDPRRTLQMLCDAVSVEFTDAMLSWPAGRRATDGIWAKYWYAEVEQSTGFQPFREHHAEVPRQLRDIHERGCAVYDQLHALRLH